jgi:hypothetical protein
MKIHIIFFYMWYTLLRRKEYFDILPILLKFDSFSQLVVKSVKDCTLAELIKFIFRVRMRINLKIVIPLLH